VASLETFGYTLICHARKNYTENTSKTPLTEHCCMKSFNHVGRKIKGTTYTTYCTREPGKTKYSSLPYFLVTNCLLRNIKQNKYAFHIAIDPWSMFCTGSRNEV
jgi:hypothetical protein